MRERLEISTAAGLGLLLLLAPAQAQKVAQNDEGGEDTEARLETEHARGSYAGVKPGGDAPPGNTVAKPGDKPAEITWPGFQMMPDGSSRVFLQTTVPLDTQASMLPNKVVIDLGNVRIVGTNRFALYTKFFNTPVTRVEIKQAHKRTTLELALRAPAQPRISTERAKSGYFFVYVDFPPGDYLPKGTAPEARLPPPAPGGEPPSSLPPPPPAPPRRASASADTSMDAELPPGVAKPKAKAKSSTKGSIT
ncbi:MAG: AMIN domain-containing protein, partial [Polyangiales bacterium]